ncbi:glycosyltransferase family 25 protein, partial [Acetobacter malorum]|uniref:glycosyltransferase family 25 protein n=1 Tax=Acetobacter malorum TaxID=178901 RepID=UPI000AA60628
ISLNRTPERTERFLNSNKHINGFEHYPGLDGKTLNRDELVKNGLIDASCNFTPGAIGSGLAHASLWAKVIRNNQPAHIFEDDAFLCHNFEKESARLINSLPENWDIILWGNNYDSILEFELLPGITQCVATFNQETVRRGIPSFLKMDIRSNMFRLTQTFGICGYAISPSGATRLMEHCLPLKPVNVIYPGLGMRRLTATSIDHVMNVHYANTHSFTAFPPLCLTDNNAQNSLNK